jgi:hypothetical protein
MDTAREASIFARLSGTSNLPILPTNPFSHSQPLNAPVVDDSEEEEDGINLIVEDALHPSVDAKKSLQPDVIAPSNGAKERKKFPWVQDWGSPNGPMWWWCQGDPTIQWGEAQKKDMKAALFKALGAAKMTRSNSNFKGVHPLPAPPKDTYRLLRLQSCTGVRKDNRFSAVLKYGDFRITYSKESGGASAFVLRLYSHHMAGGDAARAVELYLAPSGSTLPPKRSEAVTESTQKIATALVALQPVGSDGLALQPAKGVVKYIPGQSSTPYYRVYWSTHGSSLELGYFFPAAESALAWASLWLARLDFDGYDITSIIKRPLQLGGGRSMDEQFGRLIRLHVQHVCPGLALEQALALTYRASGIRERLRELETRLDKTALAEMCLEEEKKLAASMLLCVDCVGRPGVNRCPHIHKRAHMPAFERWQRVEYDHGPIAEMKDLLLALGGLVCPKGGLEQVNKPFLLHLLYSMTWGKLYISDTETIDVCPNLAPRCSRRAAIRLNVEQEVPKAMGCHASDQRGWTAELFSNGVESMAFLPFNAAVLRASAHGPHILSEAGKALVEQRNQIFTVLNLRAAPCV